GPVDTDLPPGENPLRKRRATGDGSVRPVSADEPQSQGQAPMRIRLLAEGPPTGGNTGSAAATLPATSGEPQLMPSAADRYSLPARPGESQIQIRSQPQPLPAGTTPSGPRLIPLDPRNSYLPGSIRDAAPDDTAEGNMPVAGGTGQPGNKQLEGPQRPQIAIQKIAPPQIQIGRPAVFQVVVRNNGAVSA